MKCDSSFPQFRLVGPRGEPLLSRYKSDSSFPQFRAPSSCKGPGRSRYPAVTPHLAASASALRFLTKLQPGGGRRSRYPAVTGRLGLDEAAAGGGWEELLPKP